jgi:hypothetical protein
VKVCLDWSARTGVSTCQPDWSKPVAMNLKPQHMLATQDFGPALKTDGGATPPTISTT